MALKTYLRGFTKPAALLGVLAVSTGCANADDGSSESIETGVETGTISDEFLFSRLCGGFHGRECRDDSLCVPFLARGCPGPRRIGVCVPRPRHCPQVTQPVCGCDGNTYDNWCEAAQAGVAIEHRGECAPSGEPVCGGAAGGQCAGSATCVDDPSDDCVPGERLTSSDDDDNERYRHRRWRSWDRDHDDDDDDDDSGGSCPTICSCDVIEPCSPGHHWDDDPTVCGCVPDIITPDPCAGIICPVGTECVAQDDGTAACEPSP